MKLAIYYSDLWLMPNYTELQAQRDDERNYQLE